MGELEVFLGRAVGFEVFCFRRRDLIFHEGNFQSQAGFSDTQKMIISPFMCTVREYDEGMQDLKRLERDSERRENLN